MHKWTEGVVPGVIGGLFGAWVCVLLLGGMDLGPAFFAGALVLMFLLGAAGGLAYVLLPEGKSRPMRGWWRVARMLLLSTAIGALAGVTAGAEDQRQRPWVMGLAAGVGLLTGVFLVLTPREAEKGRENDQTPLPGGERGCGS